MRSAATSVFFVLTVSLSLSLFDFTSAATFPKTWKRCKQSDPDLNKCLSIAVMDAVRKMENTATPSLGVFSIDPLDVNQMEIIQGSGGPVTLNLAFKDFQILGIAKSSMLDFKAELKEYSLYSKTITPSFTILGDYSMNGRVLLLPIQGKGKCNVTLHDLVTDHYLTGELQKKGGKEYLKLKDYRIILKPKTVITNFENLFNGDKTLGDNMNVFINENWEAIFTDMIPTLQDTFGAMFKEMAERIFSKIPFNEIFLP